MRRVRRRRDAGSVGVGAGVWGGLARLVTGALGGAAAARYSDSARARAAGRGAGAAAAVGAAGAGAGTKYCFAAASVGAGAGFAAFITLVRSTPGASGAGRSRSSRRRRRSHMSSSGESSSGESAGGDGSAGVSESVTWTSLADEPHRLAAPAPQQRLPTHTRSVMRTRPWRGGYASQNGWERARRFFGSRR